MPKKFVDVRQDHGYAFRWPSRLVHHIFKVKRVPKRAYPHFWQSSCSIANHFLDDQDSDVKNAVTFVDVRQDLLNASGWPSWIVHPVLRSNKPRSAHTPISTIFVCYSKPILGDPDSNDKNTKKFYVHTSRPWLCIWLTLMASPIHFQDQMSPEARIPTI